jgi:SAUR family protein
MDIDGDAKGLKLRRKFVKLWRKVLRSKGPGSHHTPNNQTQPADLSNGHSFRRATSLPSARQFEEVQSLRIGQIKASGNYSNLLARTKRHIGRSLSCRNSSFVDGVQEKKTQYPPKDVPKGSVAVYVGDGQEEQTRFVIPVLYFNHPLFLHLLEEAEHVYGFDNKGVLTIPCQVSDFEYLRWLIDRENAINRGT